jgi:dGTPase
MQAKSLELKNFLMQNLYRHPQVSEKMDQARKVIRILFQAYSGAPEEMQAGFSNRVMALNTQTDYRLTKQRVVADYIAGMTDRFASKEYERLTGKKTVS